MNLQLKIALFKVVSVVQVPITTLDTMMLLLKVLSFGILVRHLPILTGELVSLITLEMKTMA